MNKPDDFEKEAHTDRSNELAVASHQRWQVIDSLLDSALDLPTDKRAEFLKTQCAGDDDLLREVVQRLSYCDRAASNNVFLTGSAAEFAKPIILDFTEVGSGLRRILGHDSASLREALKNTLAGRYDIEREVGHGGMATVFKAHDLRHDRPVAIKVIDVAVTPSGDERFLREIHIAARLNHPHILSVHDSGSAGGLLYYVMPFVEGESLRTKLTNCGPLPLADVVRITRELISAIAYAHDHGVVHRDLKPENILFSNGYAVIADFGIAKAIASADADESKTVDSFHTQGVFTAGTPAYMPPERLTGVNASEYQGDIYSLGVVVYEMLTGVRPYTGKTRDDLRQSHSNERPKPISAFRNDCPEALSKLVTGLLDLDISKRPTSAGWVAQQLIEIAVFRRPLRLRFVVTAVSVVFAMIAMLVFYLHERSASKPAISVGDSLNVSSGLRHTIAVLPFADLSEGSADEYFSDGITDELSHALSRLPTLSLVGRTSSYAYKGKALAAQEIGRSLNATALVTGSVRRSGDRVRVVAQLINTTDGRVLWDGAYERNSNDILGVQAQITRSITDALKPVLGIVASADLSGTNPGTSDQEAMDLFLKGRYYWLRRGALNITQSISYFKQAIDRDPNFARAHAGLALAYGILPAFVPSPADSAETLTKVHAERALQLDSTLSDAHIALGMALESQLHFRRAIDHYRQAVSLDPASVYAHHILGLGLLNIGETDSALFQMQRASQLDPLAPSPATGIAAAFLSLHKYPEAITAAHHALAIDSSFGLAIATLGAAFVFGGDADSAVSTLESGLKRLPGDSRLQARLVLAYFASNNLGKAQALRDTLELERSNLLEGTEPEFAALVLGDSKPVIRAFASTKILKRYISSGGWLGCNPMHDPLWSDPYFRRTMQSLSVRPCALARPWPTAK